VALFARESTPITDADQHRLGTDAAGAFDAEPLRDGLLYGTFYTESGEPFDNTSPESRWRTTHRPTMPLR
jgi:hypothetical protein